MVFAAALGVVPPAQEHATDSSILREARPDEVWITQPTISGSTPPVAQPSGARALVADATPPPAPGNLVAESSGLFLISANWSPSVDPESGIQYYAFAIGTGTTPDTEANVRYWQANLATKVKVNLALTQGSTYYFSVRATNGANLSSAVTHSGPLTATPTTYGQPGNQISYVISPTGLDAGGAETSTWPAEKLADLTAFLNNMLPVLYDLYGPPSTTYTVTLVRDLRYTASAIFFPSADEMHLGDTATYQLLTHEMVHAWRRDVILSTGSLRQFDPTLSGFEEGFAQAVSYEAMTEFARRYPTFGLSQKIYQSSNEWDYDFQNVPELRTTDFWSDTGGMLLYWVRYEMAAAAIAKIEWEHPGFHRAFNAEYYRRLNLDPHLTTSRDLVKDVIQTVAPMIEGKPASQWIDQQSIFDCANHPGRKIWLFTQHYPWTDYFIFNRTYFYETFSDGSDWAYPDGSGGYIYYHLNGSPGTLTVRTSSGDVVWQRDLLITPVDNPPVFMGFGKDDANFTTQPTIFPWPGGDASKYLTNISSLDLYRMTVQFTAGTTTTHDFDRVIGAPLRNTAGVFGGVAGANGGTIYLTQRNHTPGPPVAVVNRAFWTTIPWASLQHPATGSIDTDPGLIDVTYVDATGNIYKDVRTIGYGSSNGTQAFLFDVARMTAVPPQAPAITTQPSSRSATVGQDVQFTVTASGEPPPSYQWQVSTNGGSSWTSLMNAPPYSGVATMTLLVASVTRSLNAYRYRAVATNGAGSATSNAAMLAIGSRQPFIDDVLTPGSSVIRLVHLTELRQRIDALRLQFGLEAFSWTDLSPAAGITTIRAQHFVDFRTALSEIYVVSGRTPPIYTEPVAPGNMVKAGSITEIRWNVVSLELR